MRRLLLKLRRRATLERDLDDEIRFHREMSGRVFGNSTGIREQARDLWTFTSIENLARDLRYAVRVLRKFPAYTCVCILTLALGIGLNTAVFTVYDSLTFKLLPVQDPSSLLRLAQRTARGSLEPAAITYGEFEMLRKRLSDQAEMFTASSSRTMFGTLGPDGDASEGVRVQLVSDDYLPTLGVRCGVPQSANSSSSISAIVSHTFWVRRFGSDPGILGRNFVIGGVPVQIACIAPKGFYGTDLPPRMPDMWFPIDENTARALRNDSADASGSRTFHVLMRAKPGADSDRVTARLASLGPYTAIPATAFQANLGGFHGTGPITFLLMGAVSLVLLIGCVNLLNLTLSRNAVRKREIAVRVSIGANRRDIVRQLCAETVLLGCLGGLLGLVLSLLICRGIQAAVVTALDQISSEIFGGFQLDLSLDWRVFAYTLALSLFTGVLVGLWPAFLSTKTDLSFELKKEALPQRQRDRLLTVQIAACFMLLAVAGLLFRGTQQSRVTDPGFRTDHLLLIAPDLTITDDSPEARMTAVRQTWEKMRSLPEVTHLALVDRSPFLGTGASLFQNHRNQQLRCRFNLVSGDYFDTLQVPILAGRTFSDAEAQRGDASVVISEGAARFFWPDRNPIGQQLSVVSPSQAALPHPAYQVIGIAKNVRNTFLSKPDDNYLYFPKTITDRGGWVLARTRQSPDTLLRKVRETLKQVNPSLAAHANIVSLDKGPLQIQKLMTGVPGAIALVLGLLALALAAVGVYGVITYFVAQRFREIGIRMALGAQRSDIVRLVLSEGLICVLRGTAFGVVGAICISGLLAVVVKIPDLPDLTYQAGVFDPGTFFLAFGSLALAVGLACLLPAYRATRVEPIVALRAD